MNYKSFNVAAHEMGHNVEQTLSLNDVDHIFLKGVPNTAFTEAFAFVFQSHDLELLGLPAPRRKASKPKRSSTISGRTYEIAGVALVDMAVWHWMYDHPHASPEELSHAHAADFQRIFGTNTMRRSFVRMMSYCWASTPI